jgi:hypothetical protein
MHKQIQALILTLSVVSFKFAPASGQSAVQPVASPVARQTQTLDLDLTSAKATFPAGTAATIQTAAGTMSVKNGQLLTPAQFAALAQVLTGGSQNLKLDAEGRATGGMFSLSSLSGSALGSLVVPAHVTAVGAQSGNSLALSGGLVNSGTLLAVPLNSAGIFQLNASYIQNNLGALISTLALHPSVTGVIQPVSLSISCAGDVRNLGSIVSNGVLSITAGGSITNGTAGISSPALMAGHAGVNIASHAGSITNSGTISSATGNVAIATSLAKDLTINNAGGTVLAGQGAVIVKNLAAGGGSINLNGGLLEACSIDFTVLEGAVNASLDELHGPVGINACSASVAVNGGDLQLAALNLTGDPSFVNSHGDITLFPNLGSTLSFPGQDLALIASGDILADASLAKIDLSAPGRGGNLFVSAGLQATRFAGNIVKMDPTILPGGCIIRRPLSGGSVNLPAVSIDTSASGAGASAGSVTIIARDNDAVSQFDYSSKDKGFVRVGAIDAGSPAGTGGNILINAQSDCLAMVNPLNTSGNKGNGSVQLIVGEPMVRNLVFINGTRQAGADLAILPCPEPVVPYAKHEPVPVVIDGAFNPSCQYGDVNINASGDLQIGAGEVIRSAAGITLASRSGSVSLGNHSALRTESGAIQITAYKGIDLGSKTKIVSGGNLDILSLDGSVTGGGGNYLSGAGNLDITVLGGDLSIGGTAVNTMLAGGFIDLAASGKIDLPHNNHIAADKWVFMWAEDTLTLGPGLLKAGNLAVTAPSFPALLDSRDLKSSGGIYLLSDNDMKIGASLDCAGSDMIAASVKGDMQLATGTTFTADGGDIAFLAGKQIVGERNSFSSRAAGHNEHFHGGVIELSSGFSFNPVLLSLVGPGAISKELKALQGSISGAASEIAVFAATPDHAFTSPLLVGGIVADPGIMGAGVSIDNNGFNVGLVRTHVLGAGAAVDLSHSSLSLHKGAMFFDAIGTGAKVSLPHSRFRTASHSVLSSGFASEFESRVSEALEFAEGKAEHAGELSAELAEMVEYTEFSNANENSNRLIEATVGQKHINAHCEHGAPGGPYILSSVQHTDSHNLAFKGIDTGRTGLLPTANYVLHNSLNGGNRNHQPLAILNDHGGAVSPVRVSDPHGDLILFTAAGQVLTGDLGGSKSANIIGARGTTISNDGDNLTLHGGRVYANSNKQNMTVATPFGTVSLAPETSAAISVDADGGGRVLVLGSKQSPAAFLTIGRQAAISANAGEQLTIHHDKVKDETASGERAGETNTAHFQVFKEQVAVAHLIHGEGLAAGRPVKSGGNGAVYQRMLALVDGFNLREPTLVAAVGMTAGAAVPPPLKKTAGSHCHLLAAAGTIFQQHAAGVIELKTGSLFVNSDAEHIIRTSFGDLKLSAGSHAEVQSANGQVRFRAYDGSGKVSVLHGGKELTLAAGQELMLQHQSPTHHDALPKDGIGRRQLTNFKLASGAHAVTGDFSIVSALQSSSHFKPLRNSQMAQEKRALRDRILKTALCLNIVRGTRGGFYMSSENQSQVPAPAFTNLDQWYLEKPLVSFGSNR